MKIEALEGTPGAIVKDLPPDFTALSEQDAETLRAAFDEFGLLVIRGRAFPVEEQMAVCATLGTLIDQASTGTIWFNITNAAGGYDGELGFHSDFSNAPPESLLTGASLCATVLPKGATATMFAHAGWALEQMPAELRDRTRGRTAIHCSMEGTLPDRPVRHQPQFAVDPRAEHPIVLTHPKTGREFMLVNDLQTESIVGMDGPEGIALLDELNNWLRQPRFMYRHEWQLHDLVVWDQLVMQHSRAKEVTEGERTLRRVSFSYPGWAEGTQRFFDSLSGKAGKWEGMQDEVQFGGEKPKLIRTGM